MKFVVSEKLLYVIYSLMQTRQYHGENKLIFNDMMMRFNLYLTNAHSWIFIMIAH